MNLDSMDSDGENNSASSTRRIPEQKLSVSCAISVIFPDTWSLDKLTAFGSVTSADNERLVAVGHGEGTCSLI